jgi:hypothetical protein
MGLAFAVIAGLVACHLRRAAPPSVIGSDNHRASMSEMDATGALVDGRVDPRIIVRGHDATEPPQLPLPNPNNRSCHKSRELVDRIRNARYMFLLSESALSLAA